MSDVYRILDANLNRAREAIRVMEEAARFLLDDKGLSKRLKGLRHGLGAAVKLLPDESRLLKMRETGGDVGTGISTVSEMKRGDVREVVVAGGKRLSEALRVLEEYGKVVSVGFAGKVERLRYEGYTLEQELVGKLPVVGGRQWKVCVIVSECLCEYHTWEDVCKAVLDAGADCIQLREKSLEDGEHLERVQNLMALSRGYEKKGIGPSVIVNDRVDLAIAGKASGVHLGQGDLPVGVVREMMGGVGSVGLSTHNLKEAAGAKRVGVDYVGVGAMFATATKQRRPSGVGYLEKFVARYPELPHLAIGGITPENIDEVVRHGGKGVAVSSVVCGAKRPGTVVRKLLKGLKG